MTRIRFFLLLYLVAGATACSPKMKPMELTTPKDFDWQGHRGARGLAPENSVPGFLKALEYPVKTLELDVVISKDSLVVLSHEPWMAASICNQPDGMPISEAVEKRFNLFQLTYDEIRQFDCGSRRHARFPEQIPQKTHKPLLREVVEAVEEHCRINKLPLPFYNIEIKSRPEWDGIFTPMPPVFAQLLLEQIQALGIQERACIQSFDVRALQAVRQMNKEIVTALLVENANGFEANLAALGFQPQIYSPYHDLVNADLIAKARQQNMRVIPWTVNDLSTMRALVALGVDGIITDYPNLITEFAKK